jgi:hypothetical protein
MQNLKNLSTHQRKMIEAFLEGKTIQVSATGTYDDCFMNAEDFDTDMGFKDCRTLTVINRFRDSALRIKPPEPVISYIFRYIDGNGYIGEFVSDNASDLIEKYNANGASKILKITLENGKMVNAETFCSKC